MGFLNSKDAELCKQHYTTNYQAEHQTAVEVYKDILLACFRGYMTVQLAYMILGLRERGLCSLNIFPEFKFLSKTSFSQRNSAKKAENFARHSEKTTNDSDRVFWM